MIPVPKSGSMIRPGDILFFRYKKAGSIEEKTVMAVRPVEKDASTGNTLLTCVKISLPPRLTSNYLNSLYTDKGLSEFIEEKEYRTYIMSRIIGNTYLIIKNNT